MFNADGELAEAPGPRRDVHDIDGLIYDAGFIWRPSRRIELQLRADAATAGRP